MGDSGSVVTGQSGKDALESAQMSEAFFFFCKGATSSLGLGEEGNHQRPHNWEVILKLKLSGSIGEPQVN